MEKPSSWGVGIVVGMSGLVVVVVVGLDGRSLYWGDCLSVLPVLRALLEALDV